MIKATLRYTDTDHDGQFVFRTLAAKNAVILTTKLPAASPSADVTVLLNDFQTLNKVIDTLNTVCSQTVTVLKTKAVKEKKK